VQYNCETVKDMLSLYIDNMLCDDEATAVRAHLKACSECKKEYEFLNGIVSAANTMPALSVSADLHAKIMQAATKQPVKKPARRSLWRIASGFAAAAAVVAISVISFGSLPGHPDLTPQPDPVIQSPVTPAQKPAEPPTTEPDEPVSRPAVVAAPQNAPEETQTPAIASQGEPVTPVIEAEPIPAEGTIEDGGTESYSGGAGRTIESVTCYYIGEGSYEEAVLILDAYEFDGIAYLIPAAEKDAVYEKLQALPDFVRYTEEGTSEETVRIALACE